jgi:Family of unknown function (DUF5681)
LQDRACFNEGEENMAETAANYTVGRGKPPLHSRFKKGQSGNPSGKPGPAKLAKQRLQQALYAALEAGPEELERSKPEDTLAAMAKRMALDAVAGRMPALRTVLSLLDKECESAERAEEEAFREYEMELLSLLQRKMQGKESGSLDDILWPDNPDPGQPISSAPERNEVQPFSLVQGKTQGRNFFWRTFAICKDLHLDRASFDRLRMRRFLPA